MQIFFQGLSHFAKGWQFILRHKLGYYFLFPLVINAMLFWGGLVLTNELSLYTTSKAIEGLSLYSWTDGFWSDIFYWTLWISLRIFYFLIFAYLGGYITLVMLSPVLSILSEHVNRKVEVLDVPFNWRTFINNVFRGVAVATRNTLLDFIFIALFFALSFFPLIGILAPFGAFAASAYFYGFSFVDYSLEQRGYGVQDSVRFMRENKGLVLSHGTPFSAVLHIPIIGPFLAGFVAIISTVGATLHLNKRLLAGQHK